MAVDVKLNFGKNFLGFLTGGRVNGDFNLDARNGLSGNVDIRSINLGQPNTHGHRPSPERNAQPTHTSRSRDAEVNAKETTMAIQQLMASSGLDVAVDGVWGPQSAGAYNNYQTAVQQAGVNGISFGNGLTRSEIATLSRSDVQQAVRNIVGGAEGAPEVVATETARPRNRGLLGGNSADAAFGVKRSTYELWLNKAGDRDFETFIRRFEDQESGPNVNGLINYHNKYGAGVGEPLNAMREGTILNPDKSEPETPKPSDSFVRQNAELTKEWQTLGNTLGFTAHHTVDSNRDGQRTAAEAVDGIFGRGTTAMTREVQALLDSDAGKEALKNAGALGIRVDDGITTKELGQLQGIATQLAELRTQSTGRDS